MTPGRVCRIGCALSMVVALAPAGATTVRAADPPPLLGATITASVYVAESRELTIVNRSTVEALVTVEPSGGWQVEPQDPLVLAVDASATLTVTGDGDDGAQILVRLSATSTAGHGEAAEIVLGARVYLERPPQPAGGPSWAVLLGLAALAGALVLLARGPAAPGPRRLAASHR